MNPEPVCSTVAVEFIDITDPADIEAALHHCNTCPLLADCKTEDPGPCFVGVWGGRVFLTTKNGYTGHIQARQCAKCGDDFYTTHVGSGHCQTCVRKRQPKRRRPKPVPEITPEEKQAVLLGPTCKDCGERPRDAWCGARCKYCYRIYDRQRKQQKRPTKPCHDCTTPISLNATRCNPCDRTHRKNTQQKAA